VVNNATYAIGLPRRQGGHPYLWGNPDRVRLIQRTLTAPIAIGVALSEFETGFNLVVVQTGEAMKVKKSFC